MSTMETAVRMPSVVASRSTARCSRVTAPLATTASQISRTASRRNARLARSRASARPTSLWIIGWSRSSASIARGVLVVASSMNAAKQLRAVPSATAASPEAKTRVRGRR